MRALEAQSTAGVVQVLHERPELRGVLGLADCLDERARWSA